MIYQHTPGGRRINQTTNMVTSFPLFATQGSLTLDIAISLYLIILSFLLFSLFYTTGSLRDWDQQEGMRPSASETSYCNNGTLGRTFIATIGRYSKNYVHTSILYGKEYGAFSRRPQV